MPGSAPLAEGATPRRLPARRGAKIYLAGSVVGQACALLRYTVLARLLGPEQLGLVAVLILVSNFFEMISDTGSDRFLVQDREGDEPEVQKMVQTVFLWRGAFMALGLAVAAWPVSVYFHEPGLWIGLTVLGLSPLVAGLTHLDTRRFQRHNDFRAEGLALVVAETLGLIATIVSAYLTRDYTATLYGLITRSAVMVAVSHLLAERPYRLGYAPGPAHRLRTFAVPLIANGALMFIAGQSDRLMVSGLVGLEALGHYSAVLLLVLYPTVALTRYVQGIHLPLVAAEAATTTRGVAMDLLGGRSLILTLCIAAGFAVVGPTAILVLYGREFAQEPWLVGLIGILQAGRFIRVWPTTLALGLGHSRIVLANNLARTVGIPAALLGIATIGGIAGVVAGFIVGEIAALATGAVMLNRTRGLPWTHDLDRIAVYLFGSALILGMLLSLEHRWVFGFALVPVSLAFAAWVAHRERATLANGMRMLGKVLRLAR